MAHRRTDSQRGLAMKNTSLRDALLSPIPSSPADSTDEFDMPSPPGSPSFGTMPLKPGYRSYDEAAWSPRRSGFSLPKQVHRRATYLALLALAALSTFIFFVSQPMPPALRPTASPLADMPLDTATDFAAAAPPVRPPHGHDYDHDHDNDSVRGSSWRKASGKARGPQVKMDTREELAAVTAFMAALAENLIPPRLDPSKPLDPDVVLDFDTRGPRAKEELDELVRDTWTRNPVVLFTKQYGPHSRELKAMIARLNLFPEATVIDVDARTDAAVLEPLLVRLTGVSDFPALLIGGEPVGGYAEASALDKDGKLKELIAAAGAKIDGKKKKGGRKH